MLTAAQFDAIAVPVTELYEEYTLSIIQDIARRIAKMGVSSASAWQLQRIIESGKVYENAIKELSRLTGKSEKVLRDLFEQAGVKAMKFDDAIYKAAGLEPIALKLSPAMQQVLAATLRKTQNIINNLTMTTAISAQQAFIKNADLAFMQVSTGAMSYDQAIKQAVKNVASEGISVIDYASGHTDKLDVAMRRTVLTGIGQTTAELQLTRAGEMQSNLVQVSAHAGARNKGVGPENHESWQGKVYSINGGTKQYPNLAEFTGYGTGEGLSGYGCRHSFYPFFEGISENAYTREELKSLNNKSVKVDGAKTSLYDASQIQRGIERKIREWKRQAAAVDATGLDNSAELAKVAEWQGRMRAFVKETEMQRQRAREQVQ